jgi:hypothetical protein
MAKSTKRSGGPKTDQGKTIASKNALTHGLTAKRWLNDDEKSFYEQCLAQLTEDFAPQSTIETLLIAKMAECTARLARTQQVETALYELAQAQAENPSRVIESYESDNPNLEREVIDAVHRYSSREGQNKIDYWGIILELNAINLSDISGWQYVMDKMPETYMYIIKQCQQENEDLKTFLNRHSGDINGIVPVKVIIVAHNRHHESKILSEEEINKDAHRIASYKITEYLERKLKQFSKERLIMSIIRELPKRTELLKAAATPDPQKLSLLQRYRTADDKQFSKSLGELLELQKRRKEI